MDRTQEIQETVKPMERWFGAALLPVGETHAADRIGVTDAPFVVDAGNSAWGDWTLLLGSDDTPASLLSTLFDVSRLSITGCEFGENAHFIQIGYGDTGAEALATNAYTEVVYKHKVINAFDKLVPIESLREAVGKKVWMRTFIPGSDTGTLSFYLGLREYLI